MTRHLSKTDFIIRAEHLTKRITMETGTLTILENVSLNIEHGKTLAIVGVSGSGKTTLLSILAGLDLPTSGAVYFEATNLTQLTENERANIRLNNIGFIFQNFQLLPNLTVLENVMLPLELKKVTHPKEQAVHFLQKVGLEKRMQHLPIKLSGGEQQRVAIARAFAVEPKVLFADEPTANLDQMTGKTIIDLLFEINQTHQTTLICVTHDPEIGVRSDQTLSLTSGHILQ